MGRLDEYEREVQEDVKGSPDSIILDSESESKRETLAREWATLDREEFEKLIFDGYLQRLDRRF